MTDVQEPPPAEPPLVHSPIEPPPERPAWLPCVIGAGVLVALAVLVIALRGPGGITPDQAAYTVEAFTPPQALMTASERVIGHEQPDVESPAAVMFGQGVALNVTGRVSRGIGNDWYAVGWNERTVFVRVGDAIVGDGAPPSPDAREEPEEEEVIKPEEEEDDPFKPDEEDFPDVEPVPIGVLEISDVEWIREPSARDFARFYPEDALDRGLSGRVVLDCAIGGGGRLDCSVSQESPGGEGFARAAMNIARQVRVQPTLPDGSSASGRRLRLPLNFQAG